MTNWCRQRIVYFLVILGLITAGISPACKFISGQTSFIEICSASGLKVIPVAASQDSSSQHTKNHDTKKDQCPFCVAWAHGKILKPSSDYLTLRAEAIAYAPFLPDVFSLVSKTYTHFSARGPPGSAA